MSSTYRDEILVVPDIYVQADFEEHGPMGRVLLERLYELGVLQDEDTEEMRI